jgi:hemerythrin
MNTSFRWHPKYSIGHPLLDAQHQQLLSLCAQAQSCLCSTGTQGAGKFHELLNDLVRYSEIHFKTEEDLLASIGYPRLDEHIDEHHKYIESLADFMYVAVQDQFYKLGVEAFLTTWWLTHILKSDMQYAPLLGEHTEQALWQEAARRRVA